MEATRDDLLAASDERVELIDGEIVRPGQERKDMLKLFTLPQRHRVPFDWLIWPEDRALIAHALDGGAYRVVRTLVDEPKARVPLFDEIELDSSYILGG